jgi:hypothetical protein
MGKAYKIKTESGDVRVSLFIDEYRDGSTYVGLVDLDEGEPYCDLSVNLGDKSLDADQIYLDVNGFPEAESFLSSNGLGRILPKSEWRQSGFVTYPKAQLSPDVLKQKGQKVDESLDDWDGDFADAKLGEYSFYWNSDYGCSPEDFAKDLERRFGLTLVSIYDISTSEEAYVKMSGSEESIEKAIDWVRSSEC